MLTRRILHPIFFSFAPVLFLYSQNVGLTTGFGFLRPILVIVTGSLLLWLALSWMYSSKEKAGVLVTLFLVLFFSYGHINTALGDHSRKLFTFAFEIGSLSIGPSKLLALVWSLLLIFAAVRLYFRKKSLGGMTQFLNISGAVLIALPVLQVAAFEIRNIGSDTALRFTDETLPNAEGAGHVRPDIYYIILDGYGRADTLSELYSHDNFQFQKRLEDKGFYVANASTTNYSQTILSLTSSLNFQHLPEMVSELNLEPSNRRPIMNMLANNRIVEFLRGRGYQFVFFPSGYWGVDLKTADVVLRGGLGLSEFEILLLNTTALTDILYGLRRLPDLGGIRLYDPWEDHRQRMLYILENLPEVTAMEEPTFVLAHVLVPHPPFVLDENGDSRNLREINARRFFSYADGLNLDVGLDLEGYREGYRAQLRFLNKRLEQIVDQIISRSEQPPVIILQGDHGPSSLLDDKLSNPDPENLRERMRIFNAYFFPNVDDGTLYDEITPVNTFRVLLNQYFDANFELAGDVSYFSTWEEPYTFIDVTETVR